MSKLAHSNEQTMVEGEGKGTFMNKPLKIVTSHIFPPVPSNQFDWCATEDGYEPGAPIGYGATEADAISDLRMQLLEAEAMRDTEQAIRIGKQQRAMFDGIFNHMFGRNA